MEMSIRPQDDPELISEFSTNLPCKRRNFWFLAIRCSQVTGLQTEANFLKGRIGELQARHMVPVWWNFHLDRTHQTNYLLTHYLFVRKNARGCGWGFLGVRALAHFIRYHILPQCFLPKRLFVENSSKAFQSVLDHSDTGFFPASIDWYPNNKTTKQGMGSWVKRS